MNSDQYSRYGMALGVSLGVHLLFAVFAEVASGQSSTRQVSAPPVEITRLAMDGTNLPIGKGNSSFNSPASPASPGLAQKYDLEAGVPQNIPIPPKQNPAPQPQQNPVLPQNQSPANNAPQEPRSQPPIDDYTPPIYAGEGQSATPPSAPSRPSTAGNEGQKRSRGPNRAAFPEYTVEPSVPASMIGGSVTNSVDVSVQIAADGSHVDKLVRSSGSAEVDALVLAALSQWRWDPAAREGQPIASTQNFKFTFKAR